MNITDDRKIQLQNWLKEGLSLSDIQKRIEGDWSEKITYMDLRFLLDDLSVEIPKQEKVVEEVKDSDLSPAPEGVQVEVDKVMRPGTLVSGTVTFTDGKSGNWQLDSTGRLGLVPTEEGYRPSPEDLKEFQKLLQEEIQKTGY